LQANNSIVFIRVSGIHSWHFLLGGCTRLATRC
jgi:hypothetical protein